MPLHLEFQAPLVVIHRCQDQAQVDYPLEVIRQVQVTVFRLMLVRLRQAHHQFIQEERFLIQAEEALLTQAIIHHTDRLHHHHLQQQHHTIIMDRDITQEVHPHPLLFIKEHQDTDIKKASELGKY